MASTRTIRGRWGTLCPGSSWSSRRTSRCGRSWHMTQECRVGGKPLQSVTTVAGCRADAGFQRVPRRVLHTLCLGLRFGTAPARGMRSPNQPLTRSLAPSRTQAEECAKPLSERRGGEMMPCDLLDSLRPPPPPSAAQSFSPGGAAILGASLVGMGITFAVGIRLLKRPRTSRDANHQVAKDAAAPDASGTASSIGIFTR